MANPTDAGTYHVVASLEHPNHEAEDATATVHIRPLGITGSFTADDKTYDANTGAEVLGRSLHGVIGDDDASLVGGSASFEDKNVGADKVVSLSGASLDGDHAKNYSLSGVRDAAADIEARPITITADAKSKPYGPPTRRSPTISRAAPWSAPTPSAAPSAAMLERPLGSTTSSWVRLRSPTATAATTTTSTTSGLS